MLKLRPVIEMGQKRRGPLDFSGCVEAFKTEATAQGISRNIISTTFDAITLDADVSIGTWRSATNFQNAGKGVFSATAAKFFVVASVVVILAIWVLLFQKPAPSV